MVEEILSRCYEMVPDSFPPKVVSLVIGGSIGRKTGDALSDVDIFPWIDGMTPEDATIVANDIAQRLGTVRLSRGPAFIEDFGYSFSYLYDGLTVCQVNVNDTRTARPHEIRAQVSYICFDRGGWYANHREACLRKPIDKDAAYKRAATFAAFRAINVCRSIRRNDLWFAIQHLSEMRDQLFVLARLKADKVPPGFVTRTPAKSIEKELGTDVQRFKNTLVDYSHASIAAALANALELLEPLAMAPNGEQIGTTRAATAMELKLVATDIRAELAPYLTAAGGSN